MSHRDSSYIHVTKPPMPKKTICTDLSQEELISLKILCKRYIDFARRNGNEKKSRDLLDDLFDCSRHNSKNLLIEGSSRRKFQQDHFVQFQGRMKSIERTLDSSDRKMLTNFLTPVGERLRIEATSLQKTSGKKTDELHSKRVEKRRVHIPIAPHTFIRDLEGSKWFTYERENHKISRKILHFTNGFTPEGYCKFEYYTAGDDKNWHGDMRFIEADNLLVGICRSKSRSEGESSYTHFTFQIHERSKTRFHLAIGHKTFISGVTPHVVTKTIILERTDDKDFHPGIFSFDDRKFDQKIRTFLSDSKQNRLTSPHSKNIYNHQTFEEWLNDNKEPFETHKSILGDYQLIYSTDRKGSKIQIDYLTISEQLNGKLKATYREKRLTSRKYWDGIIYESQVTNTLNVMLDGPGMQFYLMLYAPVAGGSINTLTGLIAGVRSANKGPVARMIIIRKASKKLSTLDKVLVKSFFDMFKESIRVRPPHDSIIRSFSEIKKLVTGKQKKS